MVDVPHIQELTFNQDPLQRKLGLASIDLDLVPGAFSVTCRDLEEDQARGLVDKLRARELPPLSQSAGEPELAPGLVDGD